MDEHYFVKEGEYVVGQGSAAYAPRDEGAGRLPEFPDLDATQAATIEALSVFPNLLVTVFGDNLRFILITPTGPSTCRERVEIFFAGEAALAPALARERETVVERFPAFNREDVDLVRRLQQKLRVRRLRARALLGVLRRQRPPLPAHGGPRVHEVTRLSLKSRVLPLGLLC